MFNFPKAKSKGITLYIEVRSYNDRIAPYKYIKDVFLDMLKLNIPAQDLIAQESHTTGIHYCDYILPCELTVKEYRKMRDTQINPYFEDAIDKGLVKRYVIVYREGVLSEDEWHDWTRIEQTYIRYAGVDEKGLLYISKGFTSADEYRTLKSMETMHSTVKFCEELGNNCAYITYTLSEEGYKYLHKLGIDAKCNKE